MGYGTSPYGISGFGAASSAAFELLQAFAQDARRVRAILNAAPQAISSAMAGDALNPATWTVVDVDLGGTWDVLEAVIDGTFSVDIYLAKPLEGAPEVFTLSCPTLLSATGAPISSPATHLFSGLGIASNVKPQTATAPVDVKNQPVQADQAGGALVIGSSGDYVSESGVALMRKLITRRLMANPGDFFHLPDYGVGLQVKGLTSPTQLPALKRRVEQQVALEPELANVQASLSMDSLNGILSVKVSAVMKTTNLPVTVETKLPLQF